MDDVDGYSVRFGQPIFSSLWGKAWGEQYPDDVKPFSSCTRLLLSELLKRIKTSQNHKILDLGCGTGGLSLWLANTLTSEIIAVDNSKGGIEIAQQRAKEQGLEKRVSFRISTFEKTECENQDISTVLSIDALPFAKDFDIALQEINRVLVPKGQLIFTTRQLSINTEKAQNYGVNWEVVLERNGFQITELHKRVGISELWRSLYDQWIENEEALREELGDEMVDKLLLEAKSVGSRLFEQRDWLLISAVKVA